MGELLGRWNKRDAEGMAALQDRHWCVAVFQNTPAAFHRRPELTEKLTDELRDVLRDTEGGVGATGP